MVNLGEEFVAVSLGKGLTVEGQLTGSEVRLKSWSSGICSNFFDSFDRPREVSRLTYFPRFRRQCGFIPKKIFLYTNITTTGLLVNSVFQLGNIFG